MRIGMAIRCLNLTVEDLMRLKRKPRRCAFGLARKQGRQALLGALAGGFQSSVTSPCSCLHRPQDRTVTNLRFGTSDVRIDPVTCLTLNEGRTISAGLFDAFG